MIYVPVALHGEFGVHRGIFRPALAAGLLLATAVPAACCGDSGEAGASSDTITTAASTTTSSPGTDTTTTTGGTTAGTSGATTGPAAPSIESVSPWGGLLAGGALVTILGAGFDGAGLAVTFDGAPATRVDVISDTELSATTPPGSPGVVDVEVSTDGGSALLSGGFAYDVASIDEAAPWLPTKWSVEVDGQATDPGNKLAIHRGTHSVVEFFSSGNARATLGDDREYGSGVYLSPAYWVGSEMGGDLALHFNPALTTLAVSHLPAGEIAFTSSGTNGSLALELDCLVSFAGVAPTLICAVSYTATATITLSPDRADEEDAWRLVSINSFYLGHDTTIMVEPPLSPPPGNDTPTDIFDARLFRALDEGQAVELASLPPSLRADDLDFPGPFLLSAVALGAGATITAENTAPVSNWWDDLWLQGRAPQPTVHVRVDGATALNANGYRSGFPVDFDPSMQYESDFDNINLWVASTAFTELSAGTRDSYTVTVSVHAP